MRFLRCLPLALALAPALFAACGGETKASNDDGTASNNSASSNGSGGSGAAGGDDSSSSSAGGATTSSAAGGAGGSSPCTPVTLLNHPAACIDDDALVPEPLDFGQFGAVRMTPPSYPFEVSQVSYTLHAGPAPGNIECNGGAPHALQVFVSSGTAPDNSPTSSKGFFSYSVPAATPEKDQIVTLSLAPTITLESGEHLIIAVEMVGDSSSRMCWQSCDDGGGDDGANWWSQASSEPFSWADINGPAFNIGTNLEASITGCAL